MTQWSFRLPFAAIMAFAVSACGARNAALPASSIPMQFQRIQSDVTRVPIYGSGTTVYTLGDGGANSAGVADMRLGVDGKLYYATTSQNIGSLSGEIGKFDLTTRTQTFQAVSYTPSFIDETSNGSVWVEEFDNASGTPTIDKYAGIGGTDTPISIPVGPLSPGGINGLIGGLAIGADGELWFGVGNFGKGGDTVGEINQTTDAVKLYPLTTPPGGNPPTSSWLVLGADKHIWATDGDNDGVDRVASSGASKGTSSFTQFPQGPYGPPDYPSAAGIAAGGDSKIYAAVPFLGTSTGEGALDSGPAKAAPSFASLALPSIGIEPIVVAAGSGKIYFLDFHFGGLGIYDIANKKIVVLPTPTLAAGSGIIVDGIGVPWVSCVTASKAACIERIALTATWAVYPSVKVNLYLKDPNGNPLPPGLIGMGETGNSGPFTVTSSNPKICTASVISGFDHNIRVNPVIAGKCTLSVTDAHARTVKVFVTVINGSGNPQARVPRVRVGAAPRLHGAVSVSS
ncbi:MAG TPA: hypothetical protein VGZ02_11530 [Candidatus Baltobacteraceae bacterium]|jgi:hypothetical protein|nr:hypothetical protein [Candidatus Baltobacteraceae bacterium]